MNGQEIREPPVLHIYPSTILYYANLAVLNYTSEGKYPYML